jgi:beta-phosphoglucomutase
VNLQAIVFDFDGVIANSEPLHLRAFQQTLGEDGIALSAAEYYARYLGYDDVGMFESLGRDRRLEWSKRDIDTLVARKGTAMQRLLQSGDVLFPGAAEFIRASAAALPIAVASGAMREEIVEILRAAGLGDLFRVIVAAGDTPESKPSPDPYRLAIELLGRDCGTLDPRRCVAIEDSQWGLASARGAGLRCVGVSTSYRADELTGAELVVNGIGDLTLSDLDELVARA